MNKFLGKNFMRSLLALIIVISGIGYIFFVTFYHPEQIEICLGYMFGLLSGVTIFYFGTSQGSQEKNEMLRDSQPVPSGKTTSITTEVHEENKP